MRRDRGIGRSTGRQSYRCVKRIRRNDKRRSDSLVSWDRESTAKVVNELFYYFLKLTSYSGRFLPPPKSWQCFKHNVEICMVMFQSPPDSATISSHELSKSLRSTYSADFRERFSNCEPRLARDCRSSQSWQCSSGRAGSTRYGIVVWWVEGRLVSWDDRSTSKVSLVLSLAEGQQELEGWWSNLLSARFGTQ